ncbi:hypothetical protein, partial [Neptuniibacter sp.]|uniref:hypothetical protein n=1 Tax=Neptuniibacter sp. TaxID=1962643 RepID=UPI002630259A
LSTATVGGSSFDGTAIGSFTAQSATSLSFDAPSTISEGASFDIVIANVTNDGTEGDYNASVEATNDEGGLNHANYAYTVGPSPIWYEDFESYSDDATTAADNNTNDVGVDWTIESGAVTSFRVENYYMLDGSRGLLARYTGLGISKTWQTEEIDISAYDNVALTVEYGEFGTMEAADYIDIDYRLDGGNWVDLTNGYHSDDMVSGPEDATATGLLGCTVEIRVEMQNDNSNEYWSIDNIKVASEEATGNGCFSSESLALSTTNAGVASSYTFTQTVPSSGSFDLDISTTNSVTINLPDGDLSTATVGGSSFDGTAIGSFTAQSATSLSFDAPSTISEGASFDIVIA